MEKTVRPAHTEDLGGVVVELLNAVQVFTCAECKCEVVAVPDHDGLARAAAISRALSPIRFSGREVKFLRRVLDMTQAEFADAMDLTAETVSRWENDARGVGAACEKLVRHNACAFLYKEALGRAYDPAVIANMKFVPPAEKAMRPMRMVRVRVQDNGPNATAWGEAAA